MSITKLTFKLVFALTVLLLLMTLTVTASAEQKYGTLWTGYGYVSGVNFNAQSYVTNGVTRYYMSAHARAWGGSPNPLKEEDPRSCYNCGATSIADVWNGYNGTRVAKHQMQFFSYSTYEILYTSNTGLPSNSSASCWNSGSC